MSALIRPRWRTGFAVIVLLAVGGYGFLLNSKAMPYSPFSDIVAQHLSTKEILFRSVQAGHGIPFWRADQLAGSPALTNPQSMYTYPLHFPFYLWPPAQAVGVTIWLHLTLGALVYYALGYTLGLGVWPSAFMAAAALFSFKTLMAAYAGWLSHLSGITLFPLLFVAAFRLMKSPGAGNAILLGGTVVLCLHTGHLQYVYYASWFVMVYALGMVVRLCRAGDVYRAMRVVGLSSLGLLLAIGMAAYLLLPLVAETPLVSRGLASPDFFRGGHSLGVRHLLTLVVPEALGTPRDGSYAEVELWEDVAYFGLLPFLLACVGAVLGWGRSPTRFLAGGFVVSLLLALDTPLVSLLYEFLPGFRLFRLPGRLLFLTTFFGIALAGIGLAQLMDRLRRDRPNAWRPLLLAVGLILAMSVEGAAYARQYLGMVAHDEVLPTTEYGRFFATDPTVFRIAPLGRYTVSYGWAAFMQLQLISGYDPFNFRHYQEYFRLLQRGQAHGEDATVWTTLTQVARWDLLDALNVKYVVSPLPLPASPDRLDFVARFPNQPTFVFYDGVQQVDIFVYRNRGGLPRAFWVDDVVSVRDDAQARAVIQQRDLRTTAVVHGAGPAVTSAQNSANDRVRVEETTAGRLVVETESQAGRFLAVSEIWHPGWRAELDGQELRLFRTNLALMGAWLPAGRHRLVLEFRPVYWDAALRTSLLAWTLFLAWTVVHVVRSRGLSSLMPRP